MSAPTVTEAGYEILPDGDSCVRAIQDGGNWIAAALLVSHRDEPERWIVIAHSCAEGGDIPVAPLTCSDKGVAVEWLHYLAALYMKAVAA